MDHRDSYPIFDAAYFRELAAKYRAADQHEISVKLTQVAAEFEERAIRETGGRRPGSISSPKMAVAEG